MTDRAEPTHAGAVVWRQGPDTPLFLLVTASGRRDEWVLPKGHIEKGESPVQAAGREVHEETGFEVRVGERLSTETFTAKGTEVVCAYFLARYSVGESSAEGAGAAASGLPVDDRSETTGSIPAAAIPAAEGRLALWLPLAEAIERSTFPACARTLEAGGKALGLGL